MKGIAAIKIPLATIPTTIGLVLPILSEILPIRGRATTNATISLPVMIPTKEDPALQLQSGILQ